MTTANETANTAAKTYEARVTQIEKLLAALTEEVEMHAANAEVEKINWGHVGDLEHTRSQLVEALSFLGQQDSEDVKRAVGI